MSLSPLEATWDISDTRLRDQIEASASAQTSRAAHPDEDGRMSFANYLAESFGQTRDNLAEALDTT